MIKYPYYKEDKTLNLKVVVVASGEKEYLVNCKKIQGTYYIKGVDVILFEVNGTKAWINVKNLYFDHEKKSYHKENHGLVKGFVSIENGIGKYGWFSANVLKNCTLDDVLCIDHKLISDELHVEDISSGLYYTKKLYSAEAIKIFGLKRLILGYANKSYNSDDDKDAFSFSQKIFESNNFYIEKDIRLAGRYLKNTFGVEIETKTGALPTHLLNQYGLIICKDGSLMENQKYPPEFVTVVMEGAKGLQAMRNICPELQKRSEIDIKCSVHLHLGGFELSRSFIVALFMLCTKIQDDIFKMFPYYKTKPEGIKIKNYCKKIPKAFCLTNGKSYKKYVNNCYNDIYNFMTCGKNSNKENKVKHNPFGQNKWSIKSRYYWVNFANIFFSERNTVEFRIHTPTLNSVKIINWIFVCNAIIEFAKNYTLRCVSEEKIILEDVLNYYENTHKTKYTKQLSENLIAYSKERTEYFQKDFKNNDFLSDEEMRKDSEFNYSVINIL